MRWLNIEYSIRHGQSEFFIYFKLTRMGAFNSIYSWCSHIFVELKLYAIAALRVHIRVFQNAKYSKFLSLRPEFEHLLAKHVFEPFSKWKVDWQITCGFARKIAILWANIDSEWQKCIHSLNYELLFWLFTKNFK